MLQGMQKYRQSWTRSQREGPEQTRGERKKSSGEQ